MLNQLCKEAHETAVLKGWWEEEKSFGELIALVHSELSEALEEYRGGAYQGITLNEAYFGIYYSGKSPTTGEKYVSTTGTVICTKPEGIPIELADALIRIFDMCGKYGIDLDEAVRIKMEYNKTRPYRHGGKKI